jgi:hypothetical protein
MPSTTGGASGGWRDLGNSTPLLNRQDAKKSGRVFNNVILRYLSCKFLGNLGVLAV